MNEKVDYTVYVNDETRPAFRSLATGAPLLFAVSAETVISFLLHDPEFPRAIARCLETIDASLKALPRNRGPRRTLRRFQKEVDDIEVDETFTAALTKKLDWLQLELGGVHERIAKTWFRL